MKSVEIKSFKDAAQNEIFRYSKKGMSLIPAFLVASFYFCCIPTLVEPYYKLLPYPNKFLMVTIIQIACHEVIFVLGNLAFYFIYISRHPYFEQYKTNSNPWPWVKDPVQFKKDLIKAIWNVLINHFIVHPIMLLPVVIGEVAYRTDLETFPAYTEIIPQVIFFMIIEDTSFYWLHRAFHHPKLYGLIHKQHHEYKNTLGYVAEYAHPIEFAANLFACGLGPFLIGNNCHMFTLYFWYTIRTLETLDGHCGYEFPWSPFRLLPFSGGSDYHSFHHEKNIGNFCSFFTYWDTICNTNSHYWKYLSKIN